MRVRVPLSKVLSSLDVALLAAFAAVVILFIGASSASQVIEYSIASAAEGITGNSNPSVQYLSTTRSDLSQHQVSLDDYLDARADGEAASRVAVDRAWASMERDLERYLALPTLPEEPVLQRELVDEVERMGRVRATIFSLDARNQPRLAVQVEKQQLDPLVDRALGQIGKVVAFDSDQGAALAAKIARLHQRALVATWVLDGTCVWLSVVVAVILLRFVRNTRRDLERKTEDLKARSDELEQFSGRMAHDVLSPLFALSIGWELIQRRFPGDPKVAQIARNSRNALQQTQRLVNDLLDFALAGATPRRGVSCELAGVLASVLETLIPEARETAVSFETHVDGDLPLACAPGVLSSILSNLMRNAVKHMGDAASRVVRVAAEDRGDRVRVEVSDSGPGVPPELREAIFEPYTRGPTTAKGIGLGLATVKRLVESHQGKAGVTCGDRGSTFWFELPKAASEQPEPSTPLASAVMH